LEVRADAPALLRDRVLVRSWLLGARKAQLALALCLVVESDPDLLDPVVRRLVDRLDGDPPVEVPHALDYLFEQVDGRRELLAEGLGVADADDPAAAVVDLVAQIADALDLPTRLRDVDGPDRDEFPEVAQAVLEDSFMANAPTGLDATQAELEAVLEAAW
jgi:hypothetical protein